jgi:hypothetical protein
VVEAVVVYDLKAAAEAVLAELVVEEKAAIHLIALPEQTEPEEVVVVLVTLMRLQPGEMALLF